MMKLMPHPFIPPNANLPNLPHITVTRRFYVIHILSALLLILSLYLNNSFALYLGLLGWSSLLLLIFLFRFSLKNGLEIEKLTLQYHFEQRQFHVGEQCTFTLTAEGIQTTLIVYDKKLLLSQYLPILPTPRKTQRLLPHQNNTFSFTLSLPVMGTFAIHGLELQLTDYFHLFRAKRYFPAPHQLKIHPHLHTKRLRFHSHPSPQSRQQSYGIPLPIAGSGFEFKGIRKYQSGDQRRSIVWKHSLRRQTLLCREFENETPFSIYLLLDISQSMREGTLGQRKLDHASQIITTFSKMTLDQRDAVGLISFDGEIYQHTKIAKGRRQFHKILRHLSELNQIYDRKFSKIEIIDLYKNISYFLFREGLLANSDGELPAPFDALMTYINANYPNLQQENDQTSTRRKTPEKLLRNFSQQHGIELPYRFARWNPYKRVGLTQSIKSALQQLNSGQLIIIFSDLQDFFLWKEEVLPILKLARQKRHHIIFISPFSPWFSHFEESQNKDRTYLQTILKEIFTIEWWQQRKEFQKTFAQYGIPLLSIAPEDTPTLLLKRLQQLRLNNSNMSWKKR